MSALPRRILVPIDFDRRSRAAVRYARALATATQAEICLLHVVPMPPGHTHTPTDRWWIELAGRTLAGIAERSHLPPGTSTCVLTGPVCASINQYASEHQFDLVILSGRAQPDWHGSLLGPTAAAILRHSRVPVLIVPAAVRTAAAVRPSGTPSRVSAGRQP